MAGIDAGSISAELVLKADGFFKGLNNAQRETDSFQGNLKKFGSSATSLGKSLTAKLTLPIVGIGAAAIALGTNFQSGMSEVQAISGATGEDMVKLEGIAREMGATTKFSAKNHWHSATKIAA